MSTKLPSTAAWTSWLNCTVNGQSVGELALVAACLLPHYTDWAVASQWAGVYRALSWSRGARVRAAGSQWTLVPGLPPPRTPTHLKLIIMIVVIFIHHEW